MRESLKHIKYTCILIMQLEKQETKQDVKDTIGRKSVVKIGF